LEVTLENIDIVRERTGTSYQQAREALIESNGDLVQAIVSLEGKGNTNKKDSSLKSEIPRQILKGWGEKLMGEVKDVIDKGNSIRIRVGAGDKTLMEIPVLLGAAGAVFFPTTVAVGTLGLLMAHCQLELVQQS